MEKTLKILMLEDDILDAELVQQYLLKERNCEFKLVMNREEFLEALDQFQPDLILSDNTLPQFNATEALEIFNKRSLPIPFILVTGTVSEEFAASIIKLGADDYILKDRLTRLPGSIEAALEKKKKEADIRHSEEVRSLIMNAALDAIICLDNNGTITSWNQQSEKLFGWTENDVLGKDFIKTIIPAHYARLHELGFTISLNNNEQIVLDKVNEITAINHAGNQFPIELAIVHIKQNTADFYCSYIRDITGRKSAEAELKSMENKILDQKIQEQKKISRAIIKAQEEEKNYIGQELHDNINQMLAGTKMYLSMAAKKDEAIRELVKYPMELIDISIQEIRLLSSKQVTPLRNINLEELVKQLLDTFNQKGKHINFEYSVKDALVSDDLKLNIYRVIQEQINNIQKHADAKNVSIIISTKDESINITLQDDGKGFIVTEKRKGIGISNMMNRIESYNGKMQMESSPGEGCKITVKIPY